MHHTRDSGSAGGDDLDALIGDLQGEAARRRAEPGYPLEAEARIGIELDRHAPRPLPTKLERLAQAATQTGTHQMPAAGGLAGRVAGKALSPQIQALTGQVAALGGIVGNALHILSVRLTDAEVRLQRLEHPARGSEKPHPTSGSLGTEPVPGLEDWSALVPALLGNPSGRVLYSGVEVETVVATWRAAGIDAYGITRTGDRYQTNPDVRFGTELEHLRSVAGDALAAVVLAGPVGIGDGSALRQVADQVARVTRTAAIWSEAPWWWRERIGDEAADLAPARPLSAETWMVALHRAGFVPTAEYGPDGTTYQVLARRG